MIKSKFLVLGCTGQIGSRLVRKLNGLGLAVNGVRKTNQCLLKSALHECTKFDLLSDDAFNLMNQLQPEILVHTAWINTPSIFWSSTRNIDWSSSSINLIKAFQRSGGKYLIVTGSCAEYSWGQSNKLNEDSPELPDSVYGRERLRLLDWIRQSSIEFLWTRTFFQFGGNEPYGRLISSLIDDLLLEKRFEVLDMNQIRDFVYVDDLASNLVKLIQVRASGVYNLGSGLPYPVGTIACKLALMLGRTELLDYNQSQEKISVVVSDSRKLESLLGRELWRPLDEALERTIHLRRKMYNSIK